MWVYMLLLSFLHCYFTKSPSYHPCRLTIFLISDTSPTLCYFFLAFTHTLTGPHNPACFLMMMTLR